MCSINHDLKAIYFHIPKNGGLYVENILNKYYGFKTLYFTREDHYKYDIKEKEEFNKLYFKNIKNGFINIRKEGILRYLQTSDEYNKLMDMNEEKWNSYYKFTFVRNPYSKIVSAYNYCSPDKDKITFEKFLKMKNNVNNYIYTHSFITQYEHMLNYNNSINFNYVGKFENLDEDLVKILLEIGVKKIVHSSFLKSNKKVNSSNDIKEYVDYYNSINIKFVNEYFKIDFDIFGYAMYDDVIDLIDNYEKIDIEKIKKELYLKLLSEDKILDECEQTIQTEDGIHVNIDNFILNNGEIDNKLRDNQLEFKNKIKFTPEVIMTLLQNPKFSLKNN